MRPEREILEKRRLYSKTFDKGDGAFRLEVGRQPLHYVKDGRLVDIDLTPRLDAALGHHRIDRCGYDLRIADKDGPAYRYVSVSGSQVEVTLQAPNAVKMQPVGDDGLCKWAEVAKDSDYVIAPKPLGCSTWLYLHSPDAPRKWTWRVRGDIKMIRPLKGFDAEGRILQLIESRDEANGTISVEWTGKTTSRSRARKARDADIWSDGATYPIWIDPTVNENIVAGADDVTSAWTNGTVFYAFNTAFHTMSMGNITFSAGAVNESYQAGLRFQTIAIPAGATVNSATLTVRVRSGGVHGSPNIIFYGNKVASASAWADPGNRVHNITKTTASTIKTSWTANADNTIAVTGQVAEILGLSGWASNNNLALAGFRNGGAGADNFVEFAALEHTTLTEARLSIDYTAGTTHNQSVTADATCAVSAAKAVATTLTAADASLAVAFGSFAIGKLVSALASETATTIKTMAFALGAASIAASAAVLKSFVQIVSAAISFEVATVSKNVSKIIAVFLAAAMTVQRNMAVNISVTLSNLAVIAKVLRHTGRALLAGKGVTRSYWKGRN